MVNQICSPDWFRRSRKGFGSPGRPDLIRSGSSTSSRRTAQPRQMDNRHKTMIAGEFNSGFAVEWVREDLAICLDEARRSGASLPVPRWWISSRARSGRKAAAVATYQVLSPAFRLTR